MSGKYIPAGAYHDIRARVPLAECRHYGLQLDRSEKMALCPFHKDTRPSMSLHGEHFKCFACGASGSVVDLAAQLLGVDIRAAALRLDEDFRLGLAIDGSRPLSQAERAERNAQRAQQDREAAILAGLEDWRQHKLQALTLRRRALWQAKQHGPKAPDDEPSADYLLACRELDALDDRLDALECGEPQTVARLYREEVSACAR